jgi:hypothetical protein
MNKHALLLDVVAALCMLAVVTAGAALISQLMQFWR